MNKHIIIITYHMIPNTRIWGSSQRCYYLANQLVDEGYDVSIVHGSYGEFKHEGKFAKFEQYPIHITPKFIQNYQFRVGKGYAKQFVVTNSGQNRIVYKMMMVFLKTVFKKLDKFIFNDFGSVGLILSFWNRSAYKQIKELLNTKPTGIIIFSGPYFTTFSLAKKIKRNNPGVKLIFDYRDPWNLLKEGSAISRMRENELLKTADLYSFFSDRFSHDMQKKFKLSKSKCITMYNGFDAHLWDDVKNKVSKVCKNQLVITYAGSDLSFHQGSGRDPQNLMRAVNSSRYSDNIVLNLVGCSDNEDFAKLNYDGPAQINIIGQVSHAESLNYLNESDVAVVLSSDKEPSKYTVTGKLFDCIASGRYILGIGNSDDIDYMRIIKRYGFGSICSNSVKDLTQRMDHLFEMKQCDALFSIQHNESMNFSRSFQNQQLVDRIRQLTNDKAYLPNFGSSRH